MESSTERLFYLDNIKIFLTILVVFHHTGQAYGEGGGWPYSPTLDEHVSWLGNFFPVNAAFFMGLYFMISAYFVPHSLEKDGVKMFVLKKMKRLIIPMLAVVTILSIVSSKLEFAHTWFLEHLLFYSFAFVSFSFLCKKTGWSLKGKKPLGLPLLLFLAVILTIMTYFVRLTYPIDHWVLFGGFFSCEPAHLPQYILMFVLGIIAYRKRWFNTLSPLVGTTLLVVSCLLVLMVYLRPVSPFLRDNIWWNWYWYETLLCLSLCFGFVYLFREKFNRTSPVLRWLADQSYAVYIFHLFILVGLQFAFDEIYMGNGTIKFLFIGFMGTVASFIVAYLVRCLPGMRKIL